MAAGWRDAGSDNVLVLEKPGQLLDCEAGPLLSVCLGAVVQRSKRITGKAPRSEGHGLERAKWAADIMGSDAPDAEGTTGGDEDTLAADVEQGLRAWSVLSVIGGPGEEQRKTIAIQEPELPCSS